MFINKSILLTPDSPLERTFPLKYKQMNYTVVEDGDNDEDENYTGETLSIIIIIKSFVELL